jgi:hypothetical protein
MPVSLNGSWIGGVEEDDDEEKEFMFVCLITCDEPKEYAKVQSVLTYACSKPLDMPGGQKHLEMDQADESEFMVSLSLEEHNVVKTGAEPHMITSWLCEGLKIELNNVGITVSDVQISAA